MQIHVYLLAKDIHTPESAKRGAKQDERIEGGKQQLGL